MASCFASIKEARVHFVIFVWEKMDSIYSYGFKCNKYTVIAQIFLYAQNFEFQIYVLDCPLDISIICLKNFN